MILLMDESIKGIPPFECCVETRDNKIMEWYVLLKLFFNFNNFPISFPSQAYFNFSGQDLVDDLDGQWS